MSRRRSAERERRRQERAARESVSGRSETPAAAEPVSDPPSDAERTQGDCDPAPVARTDDSLSVALSTRAETETHEAPAGAGEGDPPTPSPAPPQPEDRAPAIARRRRVAVAQEHAGSQDREQSRPDDRVQRTVRLSRNVDATVRAIAQHRGIDVNAAISVAITADFDRLFGPPPRPGGE